MQYSSKIIVSINHIWGNQFSLNLSQHTERNFGDHKKTCIFQQIPLSNLVSLKKTSNPPLAASLISPLQPCPWSAPTSRGLSQLPLAGSLISPQQPLPSQPPLAGSLLIPHQPDLQLAPNGRFLVSHHWLDPQLSPTSWILSQPPLAVFLVIPPTSRVLFSPQQPHPSQPQLAASLVSPSSRIPS